MSRAPRSVAISTFAAGVVAASLVVSCSSSNNAVRGSEDPAPAKGEVTVRVDLRIELFSILFRLAGAEEYGVPRASRYAADVDRHFGAFRGHPAVARTRELIERFEIGYNAPVSLAVHLDDTLSPLRPLAPPVPRLDARWSKVELEPYLTAVRSFAAESEAARFFVEHADYHRDVEARYHAIFDPTARVWLDELFGPLGHSTYTIVPGLLTGPWSYSATAVMPDESRHIAMVIALDRLDERGLPSLGEPDADMLVHELAHAYVNPIVDRHLAALEAPVAQIFAAVEAPMKLQAYTSWKTIAYESVVRAATIAFVRERRGATSAARMVRMQESAGFFWVDGLSMVLATIKRDRTGFEPVIELFRRTASEGVRVPPFRGPMSGIWFRDPTMVLPGGDASGTQALVAYIESKRTGAYAEIPVERAGETTTEAARTMIAFGSPASSTAVRGLLERWKFRVDADGVTVADRRVDGEHLLLLAARPNPDDPWRALAIYAGADDADLIGIWDHPHGDTDWLVVQRTKDGFRDIASGDF